MKKSILTILIISFLLSACKNKSLDDHFNSKTFTQDLSVLNEKKLLSDSDKSLLLSYISNTGDSISLANSYLQLLSDAKTMKKKEKELNAQLTIKVNRKYLDQEMDGDIMKNYQILETVCSNNSDRNITGFGIKINFKNYENQIFYTLSWDVDKGIIAHSTRLIQLYTGEYNGNNLDQVKLEGADLSKIKVDYQINNILYDDGTSISLK